MRNIQEIPKNLTNGLDNVIVLFFKIYRLLFK